MNVKSKESEKISLSQPFMVGETYSIKTWDPKTHQPEPEKVYTIMKADEKRIVLRCGKERLIKTPRRYNKNGRNIWYFRINGNMICKNND